jgi:hypothetical protein
VDFFFMTLPSYVGGATNLVPLMRCLREAANGDVTVATISDIDHGMWVCTQIGVWKAMRRAAILAKGPGSDHGLDPQAPAAVVDVVTSQGG